MVRVDGDKVVGAVAEEGAPEGEAHQLHHPHDERVILLKEVGPLGVFRVVLMVLRVNEVVIIYSPCFLRPAVASR
jgi:hypothetical protein